MWIASYVSNWYCENCVNSMFTMDEYYSVNKHASAVAVLDFSLALSLHVYKGKINAVEAVAMSLTSAAVLNRIYIPQMDLLATSMLLIVTPRSLLSIVAVADVFNALIMAFFFDRDVVTTLLRAIGTPHVEPASPFNARSIIQFFANIRN